MPAFIFGNSWIQVVNGHLVICFDPAIKPWYNTRNDYFSMGIKVEKITDNFYKQIILLTDVSKLMKMGSHHIILFQFEVER